MKKIIFFLIILLSLFSCAKKDYYVRPLKIKIINKTNNMSIKNIEVIYIIYNSGLSSDLHNSYRKMIIFEEYKSNENGIIEIPSHSIKQGLNKSFDKELIFINLKLDKSILEMFNTNYNNKQRYSELIDSFSTNLDDNKFDNISKKYKGAFIHINTYDDKIIKNMGVANEEIGKAYFIGNKSYKKEKEELIINID